MTGDEWVEIFAPGAVNEVTTALAEWRHASAARRRIEDADLRLDLVRTAEGDRLRVRVRLGAEDSGAQI